MYANGTGVPQDIVTAHMWFSLAVASGLESAEENLVQAEKVMTADQLIESQRMSREWMAKPQ